MDQAVRSGVHDPARQRTPTLRAYYHQICIGVLGCLDECVYWRLGDDDGLDKRAHVLAAVDDLLDGLFGLAYRRVDVRL